MSRCLRITTLLSMVAALCACTSRTVVSRENANPRPEVVAPAAMKTARTKAQPQSQRAEEARERSSKKVENDRQRATPSLASHEGPRALELEKLSTKTAEGQGLMLQGAAIGRQEIARHKNSPDNASG